MQTMKKIAIIIFLMVCFNAPAFEQIVNKAIIEAEKKTDRKLGVDKYIQKMKEIRIANDPIPKRI